MDGLERMEAFFAARVEGYDEHMLSEVEGCRNGYIMLAGYVPDGCAQLLDLGCGTGLELERVFARQPAIEVTAVDMTQVMLDRLLTKYPDRRITTVCASYTDVQLGDDAFDCAVSFETMHHLTHTAKLALYRRICAALHPGGVYIEGDYMVEERSEEEHWLAESTRLRAEQCISENSIVHYDTPLTIDHQRELLLEAGFAQAEHVFREGNTSVIVARKRQNS